MNQVETGVRECQSVLTDPYSQNTSGLRRTHLPLGRGRRVGLRLGSLDVIELDAPDHRQIRGLDIVRSAQAPPEPHFHIGLSGEDPDVSDQENLASI